jgi:hypothetical protein
MTIGVAEDLNLSKRRLGFAPPAYEAFTSDSRLLAISRHTSARQAGALRRWLGNWSPFPSWDVNAVVVVVDLEARREQFRLETHDVESLHISDDGRTLVTAHVEGNDLSICCWDIPWRPPLHWVVGIPLMLGGMVMLFRWWRNPRKPSPSSEKPGEPGA